MLGQGWDKTQRLFMISWKMSDDWPRTGQDPKVACDQLENDVRQLALDRIASARRRRRCKERNSLDSSPEVVKVKVCPSAEELQWEPPTSASPAAASYVCPVRDCKELVFQAVGDLLKHISDLHPYLSNTKNVGKKLGKIFQFQCMEKGCQYNPEFKCFLPSFTQLRAHYARQHREKKYRCGKCTQRFGWEPDRAHHQKNCGKLFSCRVCSTKFQNYQGLLFHCNSKQHGLQPQQERRGLPMEKESEELEQAVKVCPTVEELRWKPPSNATRFICPVKDCRAFAFKSQGGLTQHINTLHPHLSTCASGDQHQQTNLRHFHCPQEGCSYSFASERWFATLEQLKNHYVSTHEEKRFPCSKCHKRFGLERDREYHERECGSTFPCGVCSAKYPSRRALLTHCKRKQHPVPLEFEKPQTKSSNSTRATAAPQTTLVRAGTKNHPRLILPKSLVTVNPGMPAFDANQGTGDGQNGQQLLRTSSTEIQTEASDTGRFLQHVSWGGVSTGCQTRNHGTVASERQVDVANMGTQVSVGGPRHASCSAQICHMGTQVSGPALSMLDSSQITDTAVQASVDVVHSGTQLAGSVCGGICLENTGSQASAVLVNNGTQMDLVPQVSAVAVQTKNATNVANMAVQACSQIADFSHMATQAAVSAADMFDISAQASYAFVNPGFAQVMVGTSLSQARGGQPGTNTATQASLPYVTLNKTNSTKATGTQMAAAGLPEESATASTGMQTSITLIPSRPKFGVIAQTQTSGDHILKSAMASANIRVLKSPGRRPKAKGRSPGRKRSVKSSEVQTQDCFSQRKKRRVKGTSSAESRDQGVPQDFSIATQTFPLQSAQRVDLMPSSVQMQQNPTLSSSGMREEESEWDTFLSPSPLPHISTSDTGLQADLDEFLSTYTAEFGVQTQGDFLSACTAEFGVQTQEPYLETCRADLGVQTVLTSIGSLLDDLDCGVGYAAMVGGDGAPSGTGAADAQMQQVPSSSSAASGYQSVADCSTWTEVLTLDSQTQTSKAASTAVDFSADAPLAECSMGLGTTLSAIHPQPNQKLFDSFDSDLSFSDCGTGTEDFFASTHTQTGTENLVNETSAVNPVLSSFDCAAETDDSASPTPTHNSLEIEGDFELSADDSMDTFLPGSSQTWDSSNRSLGRSSSKEPDLTLSSFNFEQVQSDNTSQTVTSMGSSATGVDLAAVAAADMHTQTADDLLEFLMNNMETQTTEDIPDGNLAMADNQTQTSGSVLLTPPHPRSHSPGNSSLSPFDGDALGLVSAETQTSTQLMFELDEDSDEFFSIADMQTQTTGDLPTD